MKNYTITEEQIKKLSEWNHGKRLMSEWFPEVFEEKLEIGKWYKWLGISPVIGFLDYPSSPNFKDCYSFKFTVEGLCLNTYSSLHYHYLVPATNQEVEAALIAEAEKRGFVEGVIFKSIDNSLDDIREVKFGSINLFDGFNLFNSKGWIFKGGEWAKILKEQRLSKSEAEEKLTALINDGNHYKIS